MKLLAFAPIPALAPFIARYWRISGFLEQEERIDLLPDGGVSLLLNLGDGPRSERFQRNFDERHPLIIGAMRSGDRQLLTGACDLFGITFKPGGFTHLHRYLSLDLVSNEVHRFDPMLFPDTDAILRHGAAYLDRFYSERLRHPRYSLLNVVTDIEVRKGRVRMEDLMERHCTTARQLERQFRMQIGLTPKEFIDLTRFNCAFGMVARNDGARSLMDIAWDCGYYDHAHLAQAFKKHMGRAPSDFVLSHSSKIAAA